MHKLMTLLAIVIVASCFIAREQGESGSTREPLRR